MNRTFPWPSSRRFGLLGLLRLPFRYHLGGGLLIVCLATWFIADQVEHRADFANTELTQDVESRWGAPVVQPAPSVRYVESGSIFTSLRPLAFDQQHVNVDARMNYRKRGLRYFSGFEFTLSAAYAAVNRTGHDIDVAFVFPLELDKSQVLLSELEFSVDGKPASLDLGDSGNRLMWTGRIAANGRADFAIRYHARGLDSFVYKMDPSLPAKDVQLHVGVKGGDNFDYPEHVLSARSVTRTADGLAFDWAYPSLESGISLGVVLPSEKLYDQVISKMAGRAWASFLAFMALVALFSVRHRRMLHAYEAYLLAATYGFFFVLLAYLAAFTNFYVAYALCAAGLGTAVTLYLSQVFREEPRRHLVAVWGLALVVPTFAVVLEGYTGLIYTLELLGALLFALFAATRRGSGAFLSSLLDGGASSAEPTPTATAVPSVPGAPS